MNQIIVIAIGGSFGAVMRFLVSSGVYQWLGRDFPYGTLVVNVLGSFLLGFSTEALIVQRIAIAADYRSAIFVGFIGAFTTFSTFALDTVVLIEQDALGKAMLNIFASVLICLFAVSLGLLLGRYLFLHNAGVFQWRGGLIPYALLLTNVLMALLIGFVLGILLQKVNLSAEHAAALLVVSAGLFLILSGLYVLLFLLDQGHTFEEQGSAMLAIFTGNTLVCVMAMALSIWLAKQV
ncbi:MAG: fluoride efflux transporter CrcB [Gammaproteobacteria bacterium]|nr:fluoride efflux transporter CrcB [Gammaproteobacteria bacterium]